MDKLTPVLIDAPQLRERLHAKTVDALKTTFPLQLKDRTLELVDVKVHAQHYSPEDQKRALLTGGTLNEAVKGTLVLKDATGKVIDEAKNFTLVHVPYFTERHTLVHDGNEYQIANQLRRKPGAYTQRHENGEVSTFFNTQGGGQNFRVALDPARGALHMQYGTTNIPLYPVLKALGLSHQDIAKYLGPDVAHANRALYDKKDEVAINKLYAKLVHPAQQNAGLPLEAKVQAIRQAYERASMHGDVNQHTLGAPHDKVTPFALLDAAKKLVKVNAGEAEVDDADSLAFKSFHSVDDFVHERIKLTARQWQQKAKMALNGKDKIRDALRPAPFTPSMRKWLTTTDLAAVPTGINPIELLDHAVKVTSLGEGGISSDRAIPYEARLTHPTHFGTLDPIRTPESGHAGVDIRASLAAHRDAHGNLYTQVYDVKAKKVVPLRSGDVLRHVVAFPHQKIEGMVDAFVNGQVRKVPAAQVEYQFLHFAHALSPATSLIPMLTNIQGNRAIMGSKMQTQGLPLVEREAPLVQVKSHLPDGRSYEDLYGRTIVPTAPVHGTVHKIENGFIWIKPHAAKTAAEKTALIDRLYGWATGDHRRNAEIYEALKAHAGPGVAVHSMADAGMEEPDEMYGVYYPDVGALNPSRKGAGSLVLSSKDDPNLLAHELGHHEAYKTRLGRLTGNRAAHLARMMAPVAGILTGAMHDSPGTAAVHGALVSGALSLPTLAQEAHASLAGHRLLKERGATPEQLAAYRRGMLVGGSTYLLPAILGTLGAVGMQQVAKHAEVDDDLRGWCESAADAVFAKEAAADASHDGFVKVPYQNHFPFPSKTYLHHDLKVQVGDAVSKDQKLGDSNFTRDGVLALGKNLRVAYMAYHGLNSNDAVVISESCAKKLTSEHMYREIYPITPGVELSRSKHKAYFGAKYTPSQYDKLDDEGVIKKGAVVHHKDLLVAGVRKTQLQGSDAMLGRLSKSLTKPYQEVALTWEHDNPGEIVEVVRTASQVAILIKTREPMQVGDKLSGRYGNKGVVAKIVPDHEMIRDEHGNVIDVIMTSAGVISRINPAQIIETAVSKVADKTGKPIVFDNHDGKDAVQWAKDLLKEHGVKDKEVVYDPVHKRYVKGPDGKGVLVGKQYTFKLFKSTDTNFAGHGVGPYDLNQQPVKSGGDEGAKGLGKMEVDALLAHNARNILNEAANVRSQKNDEFWRAAQLGLPPPAHKPSFAFTKFTTMLEGAGVKVEKRDSKLALLPMTDKDVLARSKGEIQNNKTLIAKNLRPESGGLFDPLLTGGPQGTLYAHISLHEPIPHPMFEEPVRRLLGQTQADFQRTLKEKGGGWFRQELAKINVPKRLEELRMKMKIVTGSELNDTIKQIKYLEALQKTGLKPHDAYVISKVPVVPPVFRPITPQANDPSQLMVSDANLLYSHLLDVNHAAKNTVLSSDVPKARESLYTAVGAVIGTHEPPDEELKKRGVKGFLTSIAGQGSPKSGFFHRKLMFRTMDVSGRGTAVPDGNLGMDQVGIPEEMLWKMLDKLLVARLIRQGYPALEARALVDRRAPAAKNALQAEIKERPVIINRAPTLHRYGIVAAYAVPVQGKTIRVNPFIEEGMNLDYDGDTLQVHAPVTPGGIADARQMTLKNLLLSDQRRDKLMAFPRMEAIIGATHASKAVAGTHSKTHVFNTREEALAAYRRGEIKLDDLIEIKNEKRAHVDEDDDWAARTGTWDADDALSFYPPGAVLGEDLHD